jgi:hypothetical protein
MNATTEGFPQLWDWLVFIALSSRADVPYAIHSQSGDRTDWGNVGQDVTSRGMPFSRSFLRRVDHTLPVALRDAIDQMKPSKELPQELRSIRRFQYRILVSVLRDGRVDVSACCRELRMQPFAFQVAAVNGILALRAVLGRPD